MRVVYAGKGNVKALCPKAVVMTTRSMRKQLGYDDLTKHAPHRRGFKV